VIAKTDIMDNLVKRQFKKYGYVILDNVIDSDSVQALRSIIEDKSKISSSERMLTIGDIVTCKELLILQFNTAIVDAVHKIFENPTYINDLQIQVNIFGNMGKTKGFHLDCGSELSDLRNNYLNKPDYRFAKIGIFFQNNDKQYGGGIDVVPYCHNIFLFCRSLFFSRKILNTILRIVPKVRLHKRARIRSGSVVIFDSRLPHRSSVPHSFIDSYKPDGGRSNLPKEHSKYVMYWNVCDQEYVSAFLSNSKKRAVADCSPLDEYFAEYLSYGYPVSYPEWYEDEVNRSQIKIAWLPKKEQELFATLYDKFIRTRN